MIAAAQILAALAVLLALASIHPRLRVAMNFAWACFAGVALCLVGAAFLP